MPARDLGKAEPGTLVTRLEHRLHHLEDRKASILADVDHASREIDHARDSIGKAFPQAAELAQARERARGIDEQLAKMATPPQADAPPGAQPAAAEPEDQQWFERSRGLDDREALRPSPAPRTDPGTTARPPRAVDGDRDRGSGTPLDQEARRAGQAQPDAEQAAAEPAEQPRPWRERARGLEPGRHSPQPVRDAVPPVGPDADRAWQPREMPETQQARTRQADAALGAGVAGPEDQQWFERSRGGDLEPGRQDVQPARDATPPTAPGGGHAWYPGRGPQMRYEPERGWEAGSLPPRQVVRGGTGAERERTAEAGPVGRPGVWTSGRRLKFQGRSWQPGGGPCGPPGP